MRCNKAQRLMSAALDGDLPARGQEAMQAHIAQCAGCEQTWQALQAMQGLVRQVGPCPAPPDFARRLRRRLATEGPRPSVALWWRPYAEAVACAVVIGLGVMVGNLASNGLGLRPADPGLAGLSLEIFAATPPNSLGGAYLAMVGDAYEK